MQVFIVGTPLETAMALSKRHLNNQINEAKIILDALEGAKAWRNHPAILQYRGYTGWLIAYQSCLRYYYKGTYVKNTCYDCEVVLRNCLAAERLCESLTPPFHTKEYFDQMKRRLYTKDPDYYRQWEHLGKSDENWYWSQDENKFIKYKNGKRIE